MTLSNEQKLLFVALADEILIQFLDSTDQFTEEEREDVTDRMYVVFDENSPKALREAMIDTARKFYEEIKESDGDSQ